MGLEQLRVLTTAEGHILKPWLGITELFFAGEVPDELKLGVVSPLPKDEEKFRPVVLLKVADVQGVHGNDVGPNPALAARVRAARRCPVRLRHGWLVP